MGSRLHTAGILQYSQPLEQQIKAWMLKVYAAAFLPVLRKEVENSDERLKAIRRQVVRMREFVEELQENPQNGRSFFGLMSYLMPLMMNGALQQFGIRPDRLEQHLRTGNRRGIDKYLGRVSKLIDELETSSETGLQERAKQMREDITSWEKYYDPDLQKKLVEGMQEGKEPTLEIDLEPEQFPFLGKKFQRHVEKARGPDAKLFDSMPKMKVVLRDMGQKGMMGAWDSQSNELIIAIPEFAPSQHVKKNLHRTLTHELRHMTQTVMGKALGIDAFKVEEGEFIPRYLPSPGMGPRETLDPDIVQALMHDTPTGSDLEQVLEQLPEEKRDKTRKRIEEVNRRRSELMQLHKLQSRASIYSLDDLEFYTHLADRVMVFEDILDSLKDKTPAQRKFAFDLYTGGIEIPQKVRRAFDTADGLESNKEAQEWIEKYDPGMGILSIAARPDSYFRHLKKYRPAKWQKAVKEFAKVIQPKLGQAEPQSDLTDLWQQFLDEKYEGGKKKIRNPNPKTRDGHPEISVNYLLKQKDPVYQTGRRTLRREFAQWRARRQAPAKGQLDMFALPPGH